MLFIKRRVAEIYDIVLPNVAFICYNQMAVTLMGISQYLHIVNFCHC